MTKSNRKAVDTSLSLEVCKTQVAILYATLPRMRFDFANGDALVTYPDVLLRDTTLAIIIGAATWYSAVWYLPAIAEVVNLYLPRVLESTGGTSLGYREGNRWVWRDGEFGKFTALRHELVGHRLERAMSPRVTPDIIHEYGNIYRFQMRILSRFEEIVTPLLEDGTVSREVLNVPMPTPLTHRSIAELIQRCGGSM